MSMHILGIRHHGPGSARHVLEALNAIKPDIILIEGPPEGEQMLQWAIHEDMKPPVALLAYVPDDPQHAVFYPFSIFSPEWQAIRYGLENKKPLRFIDMPLIHKLAEKPAAIEGELPPNLNSAELIEEHHQLQKIFKNPLSYLADIAGFEDEEEWWEHQFELSQHPVEVFTAVEEAMTSLRESLPQKNDLTEQIREAFMRRGIRTAEREMYTEIVVICGAWHVPALRSMPKQKEDDLLLKNLPKTKVETTWIPWTSDRLSFESGYGAGVDSPGYYKHVWENPEDDGTRWLAHAANVFRNHKVDISSAHIIEAVRLANALTAIRGLSRAGLKELNEATQTVMCMGDTVPMHLVRKELIVGNEQGEVPEGAPQVPIQRDLEQQVKTMRLKLSNDEKIVSLDLREPAGLQKSILFHRLQVLDVEWAKQQFTSGKGTFKEEWRLKWSPELTINLLEKAPWGNTVEAACTHYLQHKASSCNLLSEITELAKKSLPADLHEGIEAVMKRMDELAAGTTDTSMLMDAFKPLVQVSRYGNVRQTDQETVSVILRSIFYRMIAGLPISTSGIDEEAAAEIAEKIKSVNNSIIFLDEDELKSSWIEALLKTIAIKQVAPLVHGACCKILYDAKHMDASQTGIEFSKALSTGNDPSHSAAWLEGFLKDAATILILEDDIWNITNQWIEGLTPETFVQVVPLLRRTFSAYNSAEKSRLAQKVKHNSSGTSAAKQNYAINKERAKRVLPLLEKILGI
ncbi:DUF5682 family protein [Solitalea sp. MAHUQ-68]|uniref:DUF5682 family protein n=1 Tax=Solitalea agri TaxID=2953739 RepID=A0A9X2JE05_9SPHI|nr:DUF5682 family protein [Solitalea agri]MCO4294219.1 DUF5682 family protein [Solitalea agri]